MIHVCFGLYDKTGRYSKFTGMTMLSMFDNHIPPHTAQPSITVHILHDNTLTADNRDKFSYIAGQYGQLVKFYNIEELCADKIEELKNSPMSRSIARYSVGTLFRFLISYIFPKEIKRCIYLDSDIVVNLDIGELWRTELGNKIFAVVPEMQNKVATNPIHYPCRTGFVKAEDYFNAGVLLINLEKFRSATDTIKRGINFYGEHPECNCPDQDVLNYCFSTETVKLPQKFNVLVEYARMNNDFETEDRICHYITSTYGKGFGLDSNDPYNFLWLKYFMRTPWFNVDTMGRLYGGFLQMHVGLKQSMANVSAMMSGKTRAFFTAPQSVDAVKKIFSIRNDEEIILAENQTSLQKLINAMNSSRGRKLFFILLQGFPFQILMQAGFVAGRDFVNGMDFLSEAHGVNFNSYPLIKAM